MVLQNLMVGIIVLGAALFAAWRLPGNATRLRYLAWLKRLSGGQGPVFRFASRREARMLRDAAASACGSCSASGQEPKKAVPPRRP